MMKQNALTFWLVSLFILPLHSQWIPDIIPHGRTCNAIAILNQQRALLAGGNESNDSIRTIASTDDRGVTWGTNIDVIGPWLKSISFADASVGYAVGYDGIVIKSIDGGSNWTTLSLPGNTAFRYYNSAYFLDANTGYIAGGYKSNDSIQTILKTTDGGVNWSIQRDNLGPWLNAIYFTDASKGLAVGDRGVVLRTVDGGASWNPLTLTGNLASRNFRSITFIDNNTGFIAGGNKSNDSIQTILKTTDGGGTWNIIRDNLGYMLNGIDFATGTTGYAVGDFGTILTTNDAGNNWTSVMLADTINDTTDIYSVNFINNDFGILGGRRGKMILYKNQVPTTPQVTTLTATHVTLTSAQLNANVNASNAATGVRFEYGLTTSLGTSIITSPDTINGSALQQVYVQLNGLSPNTFYYYRAVAGNFAGENRGNIQQFYTNDCAIPNCDFEVWDTALFPKPVGWNMMGRLKQVISYDGSKAVQLSDSALDAGIILTGDPSEDGLSGGIPCAVQPDSIACHIRYDIMPGDSAFIVMFFKLNGNIINDVRIPITGSSAGNWQTLVKPIPFPNGTIPDSVIIGAISTNALAPNDIGTPFSVLTIDNVSFPGSGISIPNSSFEVWDTVVVSTVNAWSSNAFNNPTVGPKLVTKVTDRVSGQYAVQINNLKKSGDLSVGQGNANWNVPTFAVGGKHLTLNLYLKYLQAGNDTLSLNLQMFEHGSMIGFTSLFVDSPMLIYTPVSVDINYNFGTGIPDSASLFFNLTRNNGPSTSYAYIDNLSFDGFRITDIAETPAANIGFILYPNPGSGNVMVRLSEPNECQLNIIDLAGNKIYTGSIDGLGANVNTQLLDNGIYFVNVTSGKKSATQKLVIVH